MPPNLTNLYMANSKVEWVNICGGLYISHIGRQQKQYHNKSPCFLLQWYESTFKVLDSQISLVNVVTQNMSRPSLTNVSVFLTKTSSTKYFKVPLLLKVLFILYIKSSSNSWSRQNKWHHPLYLPWLLVSIPSCLSAATAPRWFPLLNSSSPLSLANHLSFRPFP